MQQLKGNAYSAAVEYIERILANGHTLAKFLHRIIKTQTGTIFILAPDVLGTLQVFQFNSGHFPQEIVPVTTEGVPGSISVVADSGDDFVRIIYEQLEIPSSVCIMENLMAAAGDPWLQRAKSCTVTHESEVFHIVFNEDRLPDKIADAISDARRGPDFIGAIGELKIEIIKSIRNHEIVTTSELQKIAQTAWLIFVGAYDGEGFVIWKKDKS
jgi:hypothetical protein